MVAESRLIALALVLAWLFAAPYVLPWYDGLGWAVLAMSALRAWSRFEWMVLAHTTALSLAYLPARGPEVRRSARGLGLVAQDRAADGHPVGC